MDTISAIYSGEPKTQFFHVHVRSSKGHMWNCTGGCEDGKKILEIEGNVEMCDCLATARGDAGISPNVSGICTSAANRILYGARQNVDDTIEFALGMEDYFATFDFGLYGVDVRNGGKEFSPAHHPWKQLVACSANQDILVDD